jgi:inner membrane protein
MATFISHPLFGAGAAYMVSSARQGRRKFVLLSTLCQWWPDIDTFAYLFAINENHPLGHRGFAHSLLCAALVALCVVRCCYRQVPTASWQWWTLCSWFFLMTTLHGVFDAMVFDSLGVAFFAPFDTTRYQLPWQPLVDVPIAWSALQGQLWYAQLVEGQFFGLLFAGWFVVTRLARVTRARRPEQLPTPMPPVALVAQQNV